MPAVTIEEAQLRLPQIIDELAPQEELEITRGNRVIACLIAVKPEEGVSVYGRGKGKFWLDVEYNSHLDHFGEYLPCGGYAMRDCFSGSTEPSPHGACCRVAPPTVNVDHPVSYRFTPHTRIRRWAYDNPRIVLFLSNQASNISLPPDRPQ